MRSRTIKKGIIADKIRKDWAVMIAWRLFPLLLVVLNFSAILMDFEFIGMILPLILGMILAFVLNVPMEAELNKCWRR